MVNTSKIIRVCFGTICKIIKNKQDAVKIYLYILYKEMFRLNKYMLFQKSLAHQQAENLIIIKLKKEDDIINILTKGQQLAYDTAMNGSNLFISGGAGVGKSYIIRKIIYDMRMEGKNIIVCAPTGAAAVNIEGTTIHRAFGFPSTICITEGKKPKIVIRAPRLIRKADTIIIDEVSMCGISLFDAVVQSIKKAETKENKHIQLICVGDFYQLPPVIREDNGDKTRIEKYYGYKIHNGFAFQSSSWQKCGFTTIELTEVIRQKDRVFVNELCKLRKGDISCIDYFNEKSSPNPIPDAVCLFPYNRQVEVKNKIELDKLNGDEYTFATVYSGNISDDDKKDIPKSISVKFDAKIIFTANHIPNSNSIDDVLYDIGSKKYYDNKVLYHNGSIGKVIDIYSNSQDPLKDYLMVSVEKNLVYVRRKKYNIYSYYLDENDMIQKIIIGAYYQFPIRLAYAMTIHKAQGQTISKINIEPECKGYGQLYVAVSRATSIENVHFTTLIEPHMILVDKDVEDYYQHINEKEWSLSREFVQEQEPIIKKSDKEEPVTNDNVGRPKRFPNGSKNIRIPLELEDIIQQTLEKLYPMNRGRTVNEEQIARYISKMNDLLVELNDEEDTTWY